MMIVSTTGYIIACIGPFLSDFSNNDASMMNNILHRNIDGILDWINKVKTLFDLIPSECQFALGRHSGGGSWLS